jgi:hypothetical protein
MGSRVDFGEDASQFVVQETDESSVERHVDAVNQLFDDEVDDALRRNWGQTEDDDVREPMDCGQTDRVRARAPIRWCRSSTRSFQRAES